MERILTSILSGVVQSKLNVLCCYRNKKQTSCKNLEFIVTISNIIDKKFPRRDNKMNPKQGDIVCIDDPHLRETISGRGKILDVLATEIGTLFFLEFQGATRPTRGYLHGHQIRIAPANDS